MREFIVTDQGIELLDVVIGPAGIVTGRRPPGAAAAGTGPGRWPAQQETDRKDRELERRRRVLEATIANLRTEFESVEEELRQINSESEPPAERPGQPAASPSVARRQTKRPPTVMAKHEYRGRDRAEASAHAGERNLGAAPVHGRPDPQVGDGAGQPAPVLRRAPAGRYKLEVIDLLENPQLAEGDQILAIPTLVRKVPEPIRKIIGDLSNQERVLVGLDIRPAAAKANCLMDATTDLSPRRAAAEYVLHLYITGATPNSTRAVRNIKDICEQYLTGRYELLIIDIYQQPELAQQEELIGAPTLIKRGRAGAPAGGRPVGPPAGTHGPGPDGPRQPRFPP